jgi:hypothetical protein
MQIAELLPGGEIGKVDVQRRLFGVFAPIPHRQDGGANDEDETRNFHKEERKPRTSFLPVASATVNVGDSKLARAPHSSRRAQASKNTQATKINGG